jgi:hypothetical protein
MGVLVTNQPFQDDATSRILRIMMFSQQISDCIQSATTRFAIPANRVAAQLVRPQIRQYSVCHPGNTGLGSEETSYPLRT